MRGIYIKLLALSFLTVSIFCTIACGKKEQKTIVGTWTGKSDSGVEYTFEINEDGTGRYTIVYDEETTEEREFEWKEEDDKLKLTITYLSIVDEEVYKYSFDNDTLSLSRRKMDVTLSRKAE